MPTQNQFMKQLKLRERLANFHGVVLAWSAGSMNCADVVYAGPECEGEAYMIKDAKLTQICKEGETVIL